MYTMIENLRYGQKDLLTNRRELTTTTTGVKTMMMMFVIGFALGLIVTAIGLLMILQYQDMKDLENKTGRYASTTKE